MASFVLFSILIIFTLQFTNIYSSVIIKSIKSNALLKRSIMLTGDYFANNDLNEQDNRNINTRLWKNFDLTYTVLGNFAYYNQTQPYTVMNVIRNAFDTWQKNSPYKFTDKTPSKDTEIKIIFTNDKTFFNDENNNKYIKHECDRQFKNSIAHAFYSDHSKYPGEIHINNEYSWIESTNPQGSISLETILLHEIGHILGLGHSSDPDSIMYPHIYTNQIKSISFFDNLEISLLASQLCH